MSVLINPYAFASSVIGPQRYWRINITDDNAAGSNNSEIIEMQYHIGANGWGPDQATGGTATADSQSGSAPDWRATNAFENIIFNHSQRAWSSTDTANPHWLKYDFGSPIAVKGVSIIAAGTTTLTTTPKDFTIQYSSDDSSWTTAITKTGVTWANLEMKHYSTADASAVSGSPHGTHRYWRLVPMADNGGTIVAASEIQFRSTPSGSNIASGGTASDSGHFSTWTAAMAFDGNNTTNYASSGGTYQANTIWLSYDFGSAVTVAEITWRCRSDDSSQTPLDMAVEYSDDNTTWTVAWMILNQTGWTNGSTKTFTDPNYI